MPWRCQYLILKRRGRRRRRLTIPIGGGSAVVARSTTALIRRVRPVRPRGRQPTNATAGLTIRVRRATYSAMHPGFSRHRHLLRPYQARAAVQHSPGALTLPESPPAPDRHRITETVTATATLIVTSAPGSLRQPHLPDAREVDQSECRMADRTPVRRAGQRQHPATDDNWRITSCFQGRPCSARTIRASEYHAILTVDSQAVRYVLPRARTQSAPGTT